MHKHTVLESLQRWTEEHDRQWEAMKDDPTRQKIENPTITLTRQDFFAFLKTLGPRK